MKTFSRHASCCSSCSADLVIYLGQRCVVTQYKKKYKITDIFFTNIVSVLYFFCVCCQIICFFFFHLLVFLCIFVLICQFVILCLGLSQEGSRNVWLVWACGLCGPGLHWWVQSPLCLNLGKVWLSVEFSKKPWSDVLHVIVSKFWKQNSWFIPGGLTVYWNSGTIQCSLCDWRWNDIAVLEMTVIAFVITSRSSWNSVVYTSAVFICSNVAFCVCVFVICLNWMWLNWVCCLFALSVLQCLKETLCVYVSASSLRVPEQVELTGGLSSSWSLFGSGARPSTQPTLTVSKWVIR